MDLASEKVDLYCDELDLTVFDEETADTGPKSRTALCSNCRGKPVTAQADHPSRTTHTRTGCTAGRLTDHAKSHRHGLDQCAAQSGDTRLVEARHQVRKSR